MYTQVNSPFYNIGFIGCCQEVCSKYSTIAQTAAWYGRCSSSASFDREGNKCQLTWSSSSIYSVLWDKSGILLLWEKRAQIFVHDVSGLANKVSCTCATGDIAIVCVRLCVCMCVYISVCICAVCEKFCEISQVKFDRIGDKEKIGVLILTIWLVD